MSSMRTSGGGQSFLPEDYLQKKGERRAIAISLFLFLVVAIGIVGAFFVTFRQWTMVKATQEQVNKDFAAETKKIEQLKQLEAQRDELKEKADITLALVERVPRSILLAELINRMPEQLTLSELEIKSKRIQQQAAAAKPGALAGPKTLAEVKAAQKNTAQAKPVAPPPPSPPKFEFRVELSGLAGSDEDVADYYQRLVQCPLLDRVDMIFSSDTKVDDVQMRKFKIEATIKAAADARAIEPLHVPRLNPKPGVAAKPKARDPMDPTAPRDDEPTGGSEMGSVPTNKE
ncbi:MAG: PilN domain-containing protein [Phycisphaerales bacterium]|nr:PilN domain-containing protein [Phycisphaerales bacterium]